MIPKFRLYDQIFKKIREVTDIDWSLGIVGTQGGAIEYELDDIELMQSTGLKDKNGVEIFEGDVVFLSVRDGFDHLDHEKAIVQASECHSGLVCKLIDFDLEYRIYYAPVFHTEYEVIGNIYENPELLEAGK